MTDSSRPAATLTISRGPAVGKRFEIGAAPVTIGRQDQCDVQVAGTWVSRRHARLAWTGSGYVVEDLDSTNGTFVNGERVVGPHALRSGDRLQLGDQVELAFHAGALPGAGGPH
ncbi:MAG: FHA domain-containing protein, partial [Anaerolineae bacterium]